MSDSERPPDLTQWDFVEALGDGVYGVSPDGECIFANKAALRMLGYDTVQEVLGRNMHRLIHHTRPDGSDFPQNECPLLHTTTSGLPVRLENEMLWRRDGTPFFAEYSSFPVFSGSQITGSVITFTDSSVRQDAQKRLAVQYAVSQVLAGVGDPGETPTHILAAIGAGLAWDVGMFWRCQDDASGHTALRCIADWRANDAGRAGRFGRGREGCWLEIGAGLPGQVWMTDAPMHLADLSLDHASLHLADAARAGLKSGFAFPLKAGDLTVGAIEFYSRRRIEVDDSLMEAVSTLGQQIGQTLERRRVAEALHANDRLRSAILASAPDGIVTIDANGHILEFNTAAERIFGLDAADVIGVDFGETIFPEDTLPAHRKAFAQALAGGTRSIGNRIEIDAVRRDGTRFPIEFSMTESSARPTLLYTVHLRDITGRRREQARVRESEARFRTIANAIPQLAWMAEPEGSINWYNQRWYEYTGTNFETMAGWGWRAVHHPEHLDRVESHVRQCFETGTPWQDTFPLRAKDGSYSWFLSRALPIRDEPDQQHPQGRILGWFGTNTDITELRNAEQTLAAARDEAEAANQAKSMFLANMSHELRTPLSAIIGYAEMLHEEIEDGVAADELSRDVHKIESNARHLLGLINDVLDLTKVESGKMEAYIETFDTARMVEDVAATVRSLIGKKDNRFEVDLRGSLGSMSSDVTRIRQILMNLLSNAAKFTEGGVVTLTVERVGDFIDFSVKDTGIGITGEQLARLFQRFQQADASTTRQFGGTGLGLALTKAFCAMLGGEIHVQSAPGEGSTFSVRVPATMPRTAQSDIPSSDHVRAETHPEWDIVLVVDDDETQRDLMSRFLVRAGFVPRTAAEGATALELARSLTPRVILLDVTMPGMDGWSVLGDLKADPDLAAIPVVMVTFTNEKALAMSMGAADYLVKPVHWERLRQMMERFRSPDTVPNGPEQTS